MQEKLDVAIIGGGWSGILACKNMVSNNLKTLVFERTDDIGGVFKYREDVNDVGGVIWSTHTTSSKTTTEMSDFPMPDDYPHFPSHWQIHEYLNNYIDHFNLRENILLNTHIINVRKVNNLWHLIDHDKNLYQSKNLIVCCGVHQFPNKDCINLDKRFSEAKVRMMHSCEYKKLTDEYRNKQILIYGGGETASDISAELCLVAKKVILSIPHGQWLVNRYSFVGGDLSNPLIQDMYSSRIRYLFDPSTHPNFIKYLIENRSGKCGHGIKEWINDAPYLGQFLNKSAHIVHYIPLGTLIPKGEISKVTNDQVIFTDGTSEKIDLIIFCTGFNPKFSFFNDEKYTTPINEKFKFIFDNDDPTLAFIGFARPVVGSIPALAELQSIYVGKIFSNKIKLPDKVTRKKIIQQDSEKQTKDYAKTSGRIKGLVNFVAYADQLAKLSEIYPDYFKLFIKSPKKWYRAIVAPYNNCQFLLNDEKYHKQIFHTFKHYDHDELRTARFSIVLFVNAFPFLFAKENKLGSFLKYIGMIFLWLILSPIILIRLLFTRK